MTQDNFTHVSNEREGSWISRGNYFFKFFLQKKRDCLDEESIFENNSVTQEVSYESQIEQTLHCLVNQENTLAYVKFPFLKKKVFEFDQGFLQRFRNPVI